MVKHMEWPIGIEKLNRFQTGRVAVPYPTEKKAADVSSSMPQKRTGSFFHLWPKEAPFPDGSVGIPRSVGHWEALHGKIAE